MRVLRIAALLGVVAALAWPSSYPQEDGLFNAIGSGGNPLGLALHAAELDLPRGRFQSGQCSISVDCEDGSTRFCTDTTSPFSCEGKDQDSSAGIQGHVRCNGALPISCPSPCKATDFCWRLEGRSCSPSASKIDCLDNGQCIKNGCVCAGGSWLCTESI